MHRRESLKVLDFALYFGSHSCRLGKPSPAVDNSHSHAVDVIENNLFFSFKPMENAAGRFTIILRLDRLSVRRLLALQNRQAWCVANAF
jgi:hypothetical protein